jgi:hypothetical protein
MSKDKRIDLRFINSGISAKGIELLVAELKRCYAEIDSLEWINAKAHGGGNMVHSLVHLGVTQQVEVLEDVNKILRDTLGLINEGFNDIEDIPMKLQMIVEFVKLSCKTHKIAPE